LIFDAGQLMIDGDRQLAAVEEAIDAVAERPILNHVLAGV
jgi:hypothetical protein